MNLLVEYFISYEFSSYRHLITVGYYWFHLLAAVDFGFRDQLFRIIACL
ncbi:hypothetical protein ACPV3A_36225 [Paenibacillus sp. Dod16]